MASDPEASPKRLKTLTDTNPSSEIHYDSYDDGKLASECCGICLYEGGIRGEIDSCSHMFCFICIMEWAKVESRCPLCKRRFGSIRRPPKHGIFPSQCLVNVPVRDQIFHLSGNSTIGPPDPYSNVRCSICDSVDDENLLLLCDLCDSASHTHCVGLGTTVPEGDWFCHDCTLSKAEHEKIEEDEDCIDEIGNTTIDDIVRKSGPREVKSMNRTTIVVNTETNPSIAISPPDFGARTLRQCRNVHIRVQKLRENWSAIRSGSLSFTSSSIDSHEFKNPRSNRSQFTPASSQRVVSGSSSSVKKCSKSSYDVNKAWKMMNKAKLMKQDQERPKTINQSHKHLLSKINNPFEEARPKSFLVLSSSKSCGSQKHHSFCSSSKRDARHQPQIVAKQNQDVESTCNISNVCKSSCFDGDDKHKPRVVANFGTGTDSTRPVSRFNESYTSSHLQTNHESASSRKFHTSVRGDSCSANGGILLLKHLHVLPSDSISTGEESVCLPSPTCSFSVTSNTSSVNLVTSSSSKMDLPKGKAPFVENAARNDDPKSDIQVLVKLSIKLLDGDRKLDVNVFKEIARLATHSILAACGLEQPKPGVRSFPNSVCWHTNQVQNQRRMSTLMPNCCRECFHVFVNDVVNSIMVERVGSA